MNGFGEQPVATRRKHVLNATLASLLFGLGAGSCWQSSHELDGSCVLDEKSAVGCDSVEFDGELVDAGLVGYVCTGAARPDQDGIFDDGVPRGLVCADMGTVGDSRRTGYCCSPGITECVLNPAWECEDPNYAFQCWGTNRPDALNAALKCGNGVEERELRNYCCSTEPLPDDCSQQDAIGCSGQLMGWSCKGDAMPLGQDLGENKSRADFYRLLCPVPTPAPNPEYNNLCCFMPALVPVSGTCVPHPRVPDCEPGRFGFACYGYDTPDEDYPPIHCPDPGFAGNSAEGYQATLFCCDFVELGAQEAVD